jgi:hypothetical protein
MIGAGLLVALVGVAGWRAIVIWKRSRITPEERERRRRVELNAKGKMGDATLLEVRDHLVIYSYDVRGVEYTASQDISALRGFLPSNPSAVNGVVYVKYDPRNPANSMILCEDWSGFRHLKCATS